MGSLNSTQAELQAGWQRLAQRWEETKAVWNDPVRRRFEKEYWIPLENQTRTTLKEMERLGQVIAKARQSVK